MSSIKRIDIREFIDQGYLQEVNRQFLHPLGLALEVIVDEDTGETSLGGIWDYRDDPEGVIFETGEIDANKASTIEKELARKHRDRLRYLGYIVQPAKVACEDCGILYFDFGLDTTLSNEQWRLVHPESDEGILCANCIIKRAAKLNSVIAVRMILDKGEYLSDKG